MKDIIVEFDGKRYKTNPLSNWEACESSLHSFIYSRICSRELIPVEKDQVDYSDRAVNITVENGGTLVFNGYLETRD